MHTRRFGFQKRSQSLIYWCPHYKVLGMSSECHIFPRCLQDLAGHNLRGTHGGAHQLPRALDRPNHDNCAIGGDPSDSYEQKRRSRLEYSSRKMIVSWTCCLAAAPMSSGERRVVL